MISTSKHVQNTVEEAERILTLSLNHGLAYCVDHGIDREVINAAVLKVADFLRELGEASFKEPASPELRVVSLPGTQLRLALECPHEPANRESATLSDLQAANGWRARGHALDLFSRVP
jgi:hypothetical protein